MKLKFLLLLIGAFAVTLCKAQRNLVSVDPATGIANISIPIYTLQSGGISMPIYLSNSATGVKVKDVESKAGIGWQLNAGGQVSRRVRGLPDDVKKDGGNNDRLGWLYGTNRKKIDTLTIQNTSNPLNCTYENADITKLNSIFTDYSDTEPDLFTVNAPGLACEFVFDKDTVIRTTSYQDLRITYSKDVNGAITGFVVVNNVGTKYTFSGIQTASTQTRTALGTVRFFAKQYYQYVNKITYNTAWNLTNITDINGNVLWLTYSPGVQSDVVNSMKLYVGGTEETEFTTQDIAQPSVLTGISTPTASMSFEYGSNGDTNSSFLSKITCNGVSYLFNYDRVESSTSVNYGRYFLRSVSTDQCNSPFVYKFNYAGETLSSGKYYTILPDSVSKRIDYWGYYTTVDASATTLMPKMLVNPSNVSYPTYSNATDNYSRTDYSITLTGTSRAADPTNVAAGSVSQISYYDGGTTSISYQSNDYYDPTTGHVVQGGGIRTYQVTDYDGISTANNQVRTYSYTDSLGVSTGKPVSMPIYAFTTVYNGSGTDQQKWEQSTVRSDLDLSDDNHGIVYSRVTMRQNGAGYSVYQFANPATYWDTSASPDWERSLISAGRNDCATVGMGFLQNSYYAYPFNNNPNFDFERGLLFKATSYTNTGHKVSETGYTYQRTGSPIVVKAFRREENGNVHVFGYGKYNVNTAVSKLNTQVVKRIYDSSNSGTYQQLVTDNQYGSGSHKLLTRQQTTNSDGTMETSFMRYARDYSVTSGATDLTALAIYNLQQRNANMLIESYTKRKEPGQDTLTVSGSLTKFGAFTGLSSATNYLPKQRLAFVANAGLSTFNPSAISSNVFSNDSHYLVTENDNIYTANGILQTSDNDHKRVGTVVTDNATNLPVATVANAALNEIGYNAFESYNPACAFETTAGSPSATTGRIVAGLSIGSGVTLARSISKSPLSSNYIYSVWLKASGSGSMTVTLTNTSSTSHNYSFAFSNTSGAWKYYQLKVPLTDMTSTFTAAFSSNASVTIDDVLFYPDAATVATTAYDLTTHFKIAETNTNGISAFYDNDKFGRLTFAYDQDHNIVTRKTYNFTNPFSSLPDPSYTYSPYKEVSTITPVNFSLITPYNACLFPSATYLWDFGDGTTYSASSPTPPAHTYSTAGTYLTELTVSATGFTNKVAYQTIDVSQYTPIPDSVHLTYTNASSSGSFNNVKFYLGATLVYTFTATDLDNGVYIPKQNYNVQVNLSGSYSSLYTTTNAGNNCQNYSSSNRYTASYDLSSATFIDFSIQDSSCP